MNYEQWRERTLWVMAKFYSHTRGKWPTPYLRHDCDYDSESAMVIRDILRWCEESWTYRDRCIASDLKKKRQGDLRKEEKS